MHALVNTGITAARRAGDLIMRYRNRVHNLKVTSKGRNDFVTEIDQQAEAAIIDTISKTYPAHGFLGEESGRQGNTEAYWIIDPLDGTTNYLHDFPMFCVSLGFCMRGVMEHAVIYDPMSQELFTATRGEGAQVDGRKIRVSNRHGLDGALIGTGFPYSTLTHLDAYMGMFKDVLSQTAGIRRAGSAALDLAYVAAGRLDGFWEAGLKSWDMAAGTLMIREAGGLVTSLSGSDSYMESGNIVAGTPKVHGELLKLLSPHLNEELRK
ncbi:MAG: inositol monophosphatase [Gammaproteobacteria bacterium]|nr:inositol monophosphatase [Gammaproteobacteria bacterium]